MKKSVKALLYFLVMAVIYVLVNTLSGDGITIDAVRFAGSKNALISALENEEYQQAAEYLSFYNAEDRNSAAVQWAENMESSAIAFEKIKRYSLYTDDGITLCRADAILEGDTEISFRLVVQGDGLSISNVHTDSPAEEEYQKVMTTYYPG